SGTCSPPRSGRDVAGPEPALRVLIVDDHAVLADTVRFALEGRGMEVRVLTEFGVDDVMASAEDFDPHTALVDLYLSEHETAVPLIAPLSQRGVPVLVLTGSLNQVDLATAVEAGALAV